MTAVGPNSYGNYLARLRAERYLQNAPDCAGTCILNPPADPPDPDDPAPVPVPDSGSGCVLSQVRLRNVHVKCGSSFSRDEAHQVCSVPFSVLPSLVPTAKPRLVHVSVRFHGVNAGPSRLFLVAAHNGRVVFCQAFDHHATTFSADAEFFLDVHVDNSTHQLAVYATSTGAECYLSTDRAPYSAMFPAGCSYVTLTDCGWAN